jgi:hypothetical protein
VQALFSHYPDLRRALGATLFADPSSISYTQWEAYLAIYHSKRLCIYQAWPEAPRAPTFKPDDREKELQQQHLRRLRALGFYDKGFANQEQLVTFVLRDIHDLLIDLQSILLTEKANTGKAVFLSHSEERANEATVLVKTLELEGFSVWEYSRDCLPGIPHLEQTKHAVESCTVFIAVIGQGDTASLWIGTEILTAAGCRKPRFPILVGIKYEQLPNAIQQAFGTAVGVAWDQERVDATSERVVAGVRHYLDA